MSETTEDISNSTAGKYLTFMLSQERYGLEILKVQEIIKVTQITSVPKCPDYIKGVINLRGKIIPVFDLRSKFKIQTVPYNDQTCIIVINITRSDQKLAIGVIVDTVLEVINFAASEVEPAPNYGAHLESQFIVGMGKKEENLNILIDIEKVINQEDSTGPSGISN